MDEKFRKLQREYHSNQDISTAASYIQALEQILGIRPAFKNKIKVTDETIPCLICEKPISREYPQSFDGLVENIGWVSLVGGEHIQPQPTMQNPWQAVAISTNGNYGSQVLDMQSIFFYICDGCIIRNSHKMFHYGERYNKGEGIENARDHFEKWLKALKKDYQENPGETQYTISINDTYLQTIEPYFKT